MSQSEMVRTFLAEFLRRDVTTITDDARLMQDLGLDSMRTVELLYELEERFDVEIADEDLRRFETVADVVAYVDTRR